MNVVSISRTTYNVHQANYLEPTVINTWKQKHKELIERLAAMEGGLILSGDGRSDSPGQYAKYGAFTFIRGSTQSWISS
jgi:hypothetical protein